IRSVAYDRYPVPLRGASAIVTNEGRVAVDAGNALDERHESVRQRRVVLTPHGWRRRWQQYMAHRGERVISRKATAQGMSDVLRCPVCSCAHFFYHCAHETAGAARIRHSLRPLTIEGETICKTSGKPCRENEKLCPRHPDALAQRASKDESATA